MQRHPLDILSLLFGAVFVLIGLAALSGTSWFQLRLDLWGPALVIVLGLGLLASVRGSSRSGTTPEAVPDELDDHDPAV